MSDYSTNESILEMFLFESSTLIEQLELTILECEKTNCYSMETVDEIFRTTHTIKGSSAMMEYNNIAMLTHAVEDLFSYIRAQKLQLTDYKPLSELLLDSIDFIQVELQKIKNGDDADGEALSLVENVKVYLGELKQMEESPVVNADLYSFSDEQHYYQATLFFEEGCEMENVRGFLIVKNLKETVEEVQHVPENLTEDATAIDTIRSQGLQLFITTSKSREEIFQLLDGSSYISKLELNELRSDPALEQSDANLSLQSEWSSLMDNRSEKEINNTQKQSKYISVNVEKLDELMNLVGELVVAESMVTQNPDLLGLELEQFQKASRQLRKITNEMQDMVMSIRMVPLTNTFQKMQRVVRDMSKKLNKDVMLELIGQHTEVDKNIIEQISDPIMHIVRNAIDHGIESTQERELAGKQKMGTLTLEAKNVGGEVFIIVRDDGRGLNKEKIVRKAKENNLLFKSESEMTDREIYSLIVLPGFSTKEQITEFSGRGVGMDVVTKNIEAVGGVVTVDSVPSEGTTITMKIPLTLAIMEGMNLRVGLSRYTLPITAIKESFRPTKDEVICDPDGNEMIMVRGKCYSVIRLNERFNVKTEISEIEDGIVIMVEQDDRQVCLFADELLGQQQVVVKALPTLMKNIKKIEGVSGCTLLGDGSISLILDVVSLITSKK
ncbi:MAG: chemotaxis protein CheA [Candidatus Cohnella colombiensis]|uniref:Chemotaxis protein CheA n=1 Tax=Candidatus Cohnella colombiensis TaxID=3121368 RepID=A0AA95F4E1_9BACL|nr:MAG: chemotaxis protein CheA [Cohnella sp.]